MNKNLLRTAVVVMAMSAAFMGLATPIHANDTVNVNLVLTDPTYASSRAQAVKWCGMGINDYKIRKGSQIKFLDGSGNIVGLGKLKIVKPIRSSGDWYCTYRGSASVKRADFYTINIDDREGPDYSYNELKKDKWKISLSI